ncbi:MAG TPA: DUF58 domain-containing protein [Acidimicrobiales bacterium]
MTRQGWMVVWGGIALLAAGRLVGIDELYVFGAAALILVLLAVAYVHLIRLDLEVTRTVHPARVHAGQSSRVEIRLQNLRRQTTPLLRLRDPVSGTEGAELLVPPLDRAAIAAASYRLPTERRGIHRVGPLDVVVGDSFGLVRSATQAAEAVEVTVLPRLDVIEPVPFTLGHDPLAGSLQPNALGRAGDDFYALRPYVVGDDLRQIHWPSTARHDELLVRQAEQPWQGRTTVVLDLRRSAHDADSVEVAVSAAASIVHANCQRNDLVRLVTTDGTDSGFGGGRAHLGGMLEHLAVVQPSAMASLKAVLELLQSGSGGALVVIVGYVPGDELNAVTRLGRSYGSLTIVKIDAVPHGQRRLTPGTTNGRVPPPPTRGTNGANGVNGVGATGPLDGIMVRVNETTPFDVAWRQAMRRRRSAMGPHRAKQASQAPRAPRAPRNPRGRTA